MTYAKFVNTDKMQIHTYEVLPYWCYIRFYFDLLITII